MLKYLFWFLYKKPTIGEKWVFDDGDPFTQKAVKVTEIKDNWVKLEWPYGTIHTTSVRSLIAFYKRV